MLDTKQFISAIKQIAEEKGIPEEKVVDTIEAAIAAAYKKDYGEKGQIIKAKLNQETGDVKITQTKYIVEGVDEDGNIIGEVEEVEAAKKAIEGLLKGSNHSTVYKILETYRRQMKKGL